MKVGSGEGQVKVVLVKGQSRLESNKVEVA